MKPKQKTFIIILTSFALFTFTPHVFATAGGFHSSRGSRSSIGRRTSQWSDEHTSYQRYTYNNSYYHSTGHYYNNSTAYGFSPFSLILGVLVVGGIVLKSKKPMIGRQSYVHDKTLVDETLAEQVETNFLLIQDAWDHQNLKPVEHLYSEALYAKHQKMLTKMAQKGLLNHTHSIVIDGLSRLKQKNSFQFEIDISFVAIDFLVELNTQRIIKGNNMTRDAFKQRWTFITNGDKLKVAKIKELKI